MFAFFWREISTKQISEETSTKAALWKTTSAKQTKTNLYEPFSKKSKTHLHQKIGINHNKKHGKNQN